MGWPWWMADKCSNQYLVTSSEIDQLRLGEPQNRLLDLVLRPLRTGKLCVYKEGEYQPTHPEPDQLQLHLELSPPYPTSKTTVGQAGVLVAGS